MTRTGHRQAHPKTSCFVRLLEYGVYIMRGGCIALVTYVSFK